MAVLELRLPVGQEQLEVGRGEVADGSDPEPVDEAPQRVRVLAPRRGGAATSAQIAVEALEELVDGELVGLQKIHFIYFSSAAEGVLRPQPYACARWGLLD